ncbi:hypothetical protein ACFWB0_12605 [Rhodococcus sp. NPDC060086]|uniref:hypothetical protein n=1 Tax=Rhodococcus sp. NPDC060086 TaxID=3347055 RepID=UPI00365285CE
MNKTALRTSVATALAIPAIILGAGAASAVPQVNGDGAVAAPHRAEITAPGEFWICMLTAPNIMPAFVSGTPVTVESAATNAAVQGTCLGSGGFATLSGNTE